jgi:dihydrofolate reductase
VVKASPAGFSMSIPTKGLGSRRRQAKVVVLGANVARQCLEAELLDEIIVHVAPVLVGDGVRLFERAGGVAVKLQRLSSMDEGQTTVLRYSIGPAGAQERA